MNSILEDLSAKKLPENIEKYMFTSCNSLYKSPELKVGKIKICIYKRFHNRPFECGEGCTHPDMHGIPWYSDGSIAVDWHTCINCEYAKYIEI